MGIPILSSPSFGRVVSGWGPPGSAPRTPRSRLPPPLPVTGERGGAGRQPAEEPWTRKARPPRLWEGGRDRTRGRGNQLVLVCAPRDLAGWRPSGLRPAGGPGPQIHPRGVPTIGGRAFPGVGRPSTTPLPGLGPPNAAEPPRPGNSVGLEGCRLGWDAVGPGWAWLAASPPPLPRVSAGEEVWKICPGPGISSAPAAGGGSNVPLWTHGSGLGFTAS